MEIVIIGGADNETAIWQRALWEVPRVGKVLQLNSFQEVARYLTKENPDVVFLDTEFNCCNWIEIVELIRLINSELPIALVGSNNCSAVKAFNHGVFDYLVKPIKKEDIVRVLNKVHGGIKKKL